MPARTRRGVKTLPDDWKAKIQASQIINRLNACVMGEVYLESEQVQAAKILLNKILPDVKAVEMSGPNGDPIQTQAAIEITLVKAKD